MSQALTQSLPWDLLCETLHPRPSGSAKTRVEAGHPTQIKSLAYKGHREVSKMSISGPPSGALHPAVTLPAHPGPLPPCQAPPTATLGQWQSGATGPAAPTLGSGHLFSHQQQFHVQWENDPPSPPSGRILAALVEGQASPGSWGAGNKGPLRWTLLRILQNVAFQPNCF